jgi:hypothetical protein
MKEVISRAFDDDALPTILDDSKLRESTQIDQ